MHVEQQHSQQLLYLSPFVNCLGCTSSGSSSGTNLPMLEVLLLQQLHSIGVYVTV
jgi:hypothetical protein